MKELKGILIDVNSNTISPCILKHGGTLEELYNVCKCEYVEIVNRLFNDIPCSVVCDEEGLLHRQIPPVSVETRNSEDNLVEKFVGNVFICAYDMKSLTDNQISEIIAKCKSGNILTCKV